MTNERFLRAAEVQQITGLGRSTRYDLINRGKFPKPIKLSERAVAWPASVIEKWMAERTSQTHA